IASSKGSQALALPPFAIRYSLFAFLPLFAERAYLKLESPGAARLLIKLPVGCRDGRGRHQQIRIVERFLAPELFTPLAHPGGIDAGVDDQVGDMNIFGPEFSRHRLRHGPKAELGAGKRREPATAPQRRRG